VDDDGGVKSAEGFGNVNRKRRNVVIVRVGDDNMPDATDLARRQGESDAAAIDGEPIVYQERRQALKL
jgi:hypothetical protein